MTPLWWIPALPLLGFVVNGLVALAFSMARARKGESGGPLPYGQRLFHGVVGVGTVGLSGVLAFAALVPWGVRAFAGDAVPVVQTVWSWIFAGDFSVDVAFRLDALSALMLSFVTFVGTLIHLYSVGYMQEEEGYGRYFAFLNLFMFAMLTLVLGSNLAVLFVGWEGVGLCSYLLIGFWYQDHNNAIAGNSVNSMRTATGKTTVCRNSGETTVTASSTRRNDTVEAIMMTIAAVRALKGSARVLRA